MTMNKITEIKIKKILPILEKEYDGVLFSLYYQHIIVAVIESGHTFSIPYHTISPVDINNIRTKINKHLRDPHDSIDVLKRHKKQ